jgi:hypothetical protein
VGDTKGSADKRDAILAQLKDFRVERQELDFAGSDPKPPLYPFAIPQMNFQLPHRGLALSDDSIDLTILGGMWFQSDDSSAVLVAKQIVPTIVSWV